ncbi:MAG: DMT family transporter [Chloroflexi bacterium]|nr:MAG: DMT family transporter [Chloroflexota bacterium]
MNDSRHEGRSDCASPASAPRSSSWAANRSVGISRPRGCSGISSRSEAPSFWAVSRFGPSRGALISYLAPVAGLLFAFIVLGDQPAPVQLAGAVIILTGVRVLAVAPRATAVRVPGPILPA